MCYEEVTSHVRRTEGGGRTLVGILLIVVRIVHHFVGWVARCCVRSHRWWHHLGIAVAYITRKNRIKYTVNTRLILTCNTVSTLVSAYLKSSTGK